MLLQLELLVAYSPEGVSKEDLAMYLANIANHAMDEGLLTGDTLATVENYHIYVKDMETGEYI